MSTYSDYQTRALRVLATATETARLNEDFKRNMFSSLFPYRGAQVTVTREHIKIEEVPETETLGGVPRADLTAEAVERHEADLLANFRRNTYRRVRNELSRGTLPLDLAVTILSELDLPVPVKNTHVEADVKGVGFVTFTLAGEVTEADVRAKLETIAKDNAGDAVVAAFGASEVTLPKTVTSLYVTVRVDWPEWAE
jgi:hypothetical protein